MKKKIFGIVFPLFFIFVLASGIEQIKWVSYLTPVFYIYFILNEFKEVKNKELKYSLFFITLFGLWAMVTALWSPFPIESFVRGILCIVISWSLIIGGYCWVKNFNKKEFGFLIPINILLLMASVFSLMTKIPYDYWAGYGFGLKSFWYHQNMLASQIIFTIPAIFFLPLKDRRIRIIATGILSFLNVYILVLTHSRTSLVALILSVILFAILTKRFKVLGIIILIFTCVSTFYFVNKDFHSILNNYLFKTEVSLLDRKKPVLLATYEAAGHGGWKGLGYNVSDNTVISNPQISKDYYYKGVRLIREKGVSLFALVEETGWVGLILFLVFVGYLFYLSIMTYWKTLDWTSALMICVLVGMCLHAQFEGWWLNAGSAEFRLFMGVAGIAVGKFRKNFPIDKMVFELKNIYRNVR
jgi:O-antigen ligase